MLQAIATALESQGFEQAVIELGNIGFMIDSPSHKIDKYFKQEYAIAKFFIKEFMELSTSSSFIEGTLLSLKHVEKLSELLLSKFLNNY